MPPENTPVTHVTPVNTSHSLFGKVLRVIKQTPEFIYVELKDAVHWVEARFEHADVKVAPTAAVVVGPPAEKAPETTTTATTPAPAETPAPVVTDKPAA